MLQDFVQLSKRCSFLRHFGPTWQCAVQRGVFSNEETKGRAKKDYNVTCPTFRSVRRVWGPLIFLKVWQCEVLCRRHASMGRVGWNVVGYSVWEGAHVKIDRRTNLDKQDNKCRISYSKMRQDRPDKSRWGSTYDYFCVICMDEHISDRRHYV